MGQTRIEFENSKVKDTNINNTNEDNVEEVKIFDRNHKFFGTINLLNKDNILINENDKKNNKIIDNNLYCSAENEKIIQDAANLIFGKDIIQKKSTKRSSPKKNRNSIDNINNDTNVNIDDKLKFESNKNDNVEDKNKHFFNIDESDIHQNIEFDKND